MGQENSSSLFSFDADPCACVRYAQVPMSCCSDAHELITLDDDHAASSILQVSVPEFAFLGDLTPIPVLVPLVLAPSPVKPGCHNPPPPGVPIYKTNCSLVFYDELV
jgi:hypothetical protein